MSNKSGRVLSAEEVESLGLNAPSSQSSGLVARPIAGTEKKKSPYTVDQNKAATFAIAMEEANDTMTRIEDSGFDPRNTKDVFFDYMLGDYFGNLALSTDYQLYEQAANLFKTQKLRDETGATIGQNELGWVEKSYIISPNEPLEVREAKKQARESAIETMKAKAGGAYDDAKKKLVKESNPLGDTDAAILEMQRREKELRGTERGKMFAERLNALGAGTLQ